MVIDLKQVTDILSLYHGDTSRAKQETLEGLRLIQDDLCSMIDALECDIERDEEEIEEE